MSTRIRVTHDVSITGFHGYASIRGKIVDVSQEGFAMETTGFLPLNSKIMFLVEEQEGVPDLSIVITASVVNMNANAGIFRCGCQLSDASKGKLLHIPRI